MEQFERTTLRPVEISGTGLHSGVQTRLRMLPGRPGSGIVFVRTDLENFSIPARWKYVARVSYATSLMRQGVLLSTTEHLLSVLYGLGIDNVRIEIDNLEVPIADGSALPFVKAIEKAGIKTLRRERRYLKMKRRIEVREGSKRVAIEPAEEFRVSCQTDFGHESAGRQTFEGTVGPSRYKSEIAAARTFGFQRDLDRMRDMGLIRGATLDNAVCFGDGGEVLNPGGLRFPDECCRHKVLDLIGDLALLGIPVLGKVRAEYAGHAMHAALVGEIMKDSSCYQVVTWNDLHGTASSAAAS